MSFRVAIVDFEPGKHFAEPEVERAILGEDVEITLLRSRDPADVLPKIASADAIIVWSRFELDADSLARLESCRGIVCASVGTDHVDLAVAAQRGIPVCNVPDYGTEEVADHTLALLLALVRRVVPLDRAVRSGTWDWKVGGPVRRIRGQCMGIVGFGRIGSAVARRAQAFGINVRFYDPFVPSGIEKSHGVQRDETLGQLLDASDILSLHAPLTPQTRQMIDHAALSALPRGALLLNTARGALVSADAVVDALASGQLGGAGLDVLPNEPHVPEALRRSDRVVLTPHSAWSSTESFAENRRKAAASALRFLRGEPVRDVVNGPQPL